MVVCNDKNFRQKLAAIPHDKLLHPDRAWGISVKMLNNFQLTSIIGKSRQNKLFL